MKSKHYLRGRWHNVFISHEMVTEYIHFPLFDYNSSKREINRAIIVAICKIIVFVQLGALPRVETAPIRVTKLIILHYKTP